MFCSNCGKRIDDSSKFCRYCGTDAVTGHPPAPPVPVYSVPPPPFRTMAALPNCTQPAMAQYRSANDEVLIRRIAGYERMSCIFWLILGIIQICCIVSIIAGVWNVVAVSSRWKLPERIRQRDASVPEGYRDSMGELIVIGIINLVFGGVIGVAFVIFDFYVRDKVLSNAHLFNVDYTTQQT